MGRCGCGSDQQCLSTNPGNLASYDDTGCLYVAEFTPLFGSADQPASIDLVPLVSGAWNDTGLSVTIPAAGTFELTADAYARLHAEVAENGGTPTVRLFFRLWNETASAVVPNTTSFMLTVGSSVAGRYFNAGGSTVHANVVTTGPTTVKMQVGRTDLASGTNTATTIPTSILDAAGTSLRYSRLA